LGSRWSAQELTTPEALIQLEQVVQHWKDREPVAHHLGPAKQRHRLGEPLQEGVRDLRSMAAGMAIA
jgi:hypothetical protein